MYQKASEALDNLDEAKPRSSLKARNKTEAHTLPFSKTACKGKTVFLVDITEQRNILMLPRWS